MTNITVYYTVMYLSRFYEKRIDGHTTLTFGLGSYISISVHVYEKYGLASRHTADALSASRYFQRGIVVS